MVKLFEELPLFPSTTALELAAQPPAIALVITALRYRLTYRAALWSPGERPQLMQHALEGDPGLGISVMLPFPCVTSRVTESREPRFYLERYEDHIDLGPGRHGSPRRGLSDGE